MRGLFRSIFYQETPEIKNLGQDVSKELLWMEKYKNNGNFLGFLSTKKEFFQVKNAMVSNPTFQADFKEALKITTLEMNSKEFAFKINTLPAWVKNDSLGSTYSFAGLPPSHFLFPSNEIGHQRITEQELEMMMSYELLHEQQPYISLVGQQCFLDNLILLRQKTLFSDYATNFYRAVAFQNKYLGVHLIPGLEKDFVEKANLISPTQNRITTLSDIHVYPNVLQELSELDKKLDNGWISPKAYKWQRNGLLRKFENNGDFLDIFTRETLQCQSVLRSKISHFELLYKKPIFVYYSGHGTFQGDAIFSPDSILSWNKPFAAPSEYMMHEASKNPFIVADFTTLVNIKLLDNHSNVEKVIRLLKKKIDNDKLKEYLKIFKRIPTYEKHLITIELKNKDEIAMNYFNKKLSEEMLDLIQESGFSLDDQNLLKNKLHAVVYTMEDDLQQFYVYVPDEIEMHPCTVSPSSCLTSVNEI